MLVIAGALNARRASRLKRLAPGLVEFTSAAPSSVSAEDAVAELSASERAVLILAYLARVAGLPARAVEILERHIARPTAASPRAFERLADAYIAVDRLDLAEAVLERGLRAHPNSAALHLALADTFSRMSKWTAATTHWERVPESLRAPSSLWTSLHVARAYRMTGKPREAEAVARRAAAYHPENEHLQREIELGRPYRVDWSRCLVSADRLSADAAVGAVDTLGFLGGGTLPLIGTVSMRRTTSPEVHLYVNGLCVASTRAASASATEGVGTFSINCADLLRYLGDGDVVRLACDGKPISLPGIGTAARVHGALPSRFDVLADKLRAGYVFTKFGHLQPGHTDASKRATLDLYEEVAQLIESRAQLPTYPFYGNLLGAIRDNDFIEHDVGAFDAVAICARSLPADVKAEFAGVCRLLIDSGYHLAVGPWSALVKREPADSVLVDLHYGWFTRDEELNVSFGWRFTPPRGREDVLADRSCRVVDRSLRVPGNAERLLEQLYGPQWTIPDQGYSLHSALTRDHAYSLTDEDLGQLLESRPTRLQIRYGEIPLQNGFSRGWDA